MKTTQRKALTEQPVKPYEMRRPEEQDDNQPIKKVLAKQHITVQTEIEVQEKAVFLKKEQAATHYLKIYSLYRPSNSPKSSGKTVPQLRICGDWLKAAGFDIGVHISVTVMDGLLVIRPAKLEENGD